jgi:hypothetical protein
MIRFDECFGEAVQERSHPEKRFEESREDNGCNECHGHNLQWLVEALSWMICAYVLGPPPFYGRLHGGVVISSEPGRIERMSRKMVIGYGRRVPAV